jgi:hypothetical protein
MAKMCFLLPAVSGSLSAQWSSLPVSFVVPMNTSTPGTVATAAPAATVSVAIRGHRRRET